MTNSGRSETDRRRFLKRTALAGAALAAGGAWVRASQAGDRVNVGVMGTSSTSNGGFGRGTHLANTLAGLPGVEVAYVCDVDERNLGRAVESVSKRQKDSPKGVRDFRTILDDGAVHALVIATPDHWHAPAAILACAAGKHVYVEKPCCHNAHEGELLVAAARKYRRLVQHGTQRRTWPAVIEAVDRLRAGDVGRVLAAKGWYFNARPSIGHGKEVPAPPWLDYSLWQGPAPERPFRDNILHYNWHWFWHWGTGELGNNGVHFIDVARWGLGVDYPRSVTSSGGKYRYDDDQETPDTNAVAFDFGDRWLTWENRSWADHTPLDPDYDVAFQGEKGTLVIRGSGYAIYDLKGKRTQQRSGNGGDAIHLQNFIDGIREGAKLNAEIEEGAKSALLCHLGNIAYRTGHTLHLDPKTHRLVNDPEAQALWAREYRKGWEPRV